MARKRLTRCFTMVAPFILLLVSCRGGDSIPATIGTSSSYIFTGTHTGTSTERYSTTLLAPSETPSITSTPSAIPSGYTLKDWREPVEVITPENIDRVEKIGELEFMDTVFNLAWSPDGSKFAVSLLDYELFILDSTVFSRIYKLQGGFPAFSYDGRILEVGGAQYDLATGEEIPVEDVTIRSSGGNFSDVEFSPNGDYVIGVGGEYIFFYPMKAGLDAGMLTREGAEPLHASFNTDGKYLAVNYRYEEFTELWDVYEKRPVRLFQLKGLRGFSKPKFSRDGNSVYFLGVGESEGEEKNFIQGWDYHTGKPLDVQIIPGAGNTGSYSMDISIVSDVVALGMNDGKIFLLPINDCKFFEVNTGNNKDTVIEIAFRPDGKLISTRRNIDNKIEFWGIPEEKGNPTIGPSTETKDVIPTTCTKISMIQEQPIPKHKWLAQ